MANLILYVYRHHLSSTLEESRDMMAFLKQHEIKQAYQPVVAKDGYLSFCMECNVSLVLD